MSYIQAGMTNEQLKRAFEKKVPGVTPTAMELSAFAIGVEVGFALNCDHEWRVTSTRAQGMWARCDKCGDTKEETWD